LRKFVINTLFKTKQKLADCLNLSIKCGDDPINTYVIDT